MIKEQDDRLQEVKYKEALKNATVKSVFESLKPCIKKD